MNLTNAKRAILLTAAIIIFNLSYSNLVAQQVPEEAYAAAEEHLNKMQEDVLNCTGFYESYMASFEIDNAEDILEAYIGEPTKNIRLAFDDIDNLSSSGDNVIQNVKFMYYTFPVLINDDVKFMIDTREYDDGIWRWCKSGGAGRINKKMHEIQRVAVGKSNFEYYYLWIGKYRFVLINDQGEYYIIPVNGYAASLVEEAVQMDENLFYLPIKFTEALPFIKKRLPIMKRDIENKSIQ